jgi:alanine-alpha-ketoisovalerate/valine-pyruvate aminotransferase
MSEKELPLLPKSLMAQSMTGSAVRKIMDEMTIFERKLAEEALDKREIIRLYKIGGGNPTLHPDSVEIIRNNFRAVIDSGEFQKLLRYGPTKGQAFYLDVARKYYEKILNKDLSEKNIIVTPSSQMAFFYIINGIEGKIAIATPDYVGYDSANFASEFVSIQKKPIPDGNHEFHYEFDLSTLESALESDSSINRIFLSNPNNPSGEVQPPEIVGKILKMTKRKAAVFLDTPYRDMVFEGEYELFMEGNSAIVDSYSKRGFAGLRHADVIAPEEIIERIKDLQGGACLSPPNDSQFVLARMMENGDLNRVCDIQRDFYRKRVKLAEKIFKQECNVDEAMMHRTMGTFFTFMYWKDLTKHGYDCYKLHNELMYNDRIVEVPGAPFFYGTTINKADGRHPLETTRCSLSDVPDDKSIEECMTKVALKINSIYGNTK